ncbi:MAG: hypothetical protein JO023_10585 [Chloroflexi bacterium]|nr:hypothetical protein [Chloroflexota bacterium]
MHEAAVVQDVIGGALTLARDIGKGGGGSTEEPTVCFSLLPFAVGLAVLGLAALRRRLGVARRTPLAAEPSIPGHG